MNRRTAKVSSSLSAVAHRAKAEAWAAQILSQNAQTPAEGLSYVSCNATDHWSVHMKTPRALAGTAVLVLMSGIACNRTQTSREAEQAAQEVKSAAAQAGDKLADGWLS